jgi:trigger factor
MFSPTVELVSFERISVKRPSAEIAEADLEMMIERLRDQHATQEPAVRPAQEGDQVKVDFSGELDGKRVEDACGEGMDFTIGQGQMIEDFDKGAVGLGAGEEATFDAVFPDDYRAEELQGKTVQFSVKMLEVNERKLPELDDEFFAKFGSEDGGVDGFRSEVQDNMQRELDSAIKNQIKQQVMDGLAETHEFPVPQDVVQREIQVLKDQMLSQFQMPPGQAQGLDLPDALFQDQAEKRVKVGLIVNEVISAGELVADAEKVDAKLQELAAPYGEPEQVIEWYRSNPEQMGNIEMAVLEDQVVDHILGAAAIEEVASSYSDVISGAAIAPPAEDTQEGAQEGAKEEPKNGRLGSTRHITDKQATKRGTTNPPFRKAQTGQNEYNRRVEYDTDDRTGNDSHGGGANGSGRAFLRHLLATPERTDNFYGRRSRGPYGKPNCCADAVLGI